MILLNAVRVADRLELEIICPKCFRLGYIIAEEEGATKKAIVYHDSAYCSLEL